MPPTDSAGFALLVASCQCGAGEGILLRSLVAVGLRPGDRQLHAHARKRRRGEEWGGERAARSRPSRQLGQRRLTRMGPGSSWFAHRDGSGTMQVVGQPPHDPAVEHGHERRGDPCAMATRSWRFWAEFEQSGCS